MIRAAMLVGVLGAIFCASALADTQPQPSRVDYDDAKFFCVFSSEVKGTPVCKAYGKFDAKKPCDHEIKWGDEDDFLRVVCGDGDADTDDQVIYNDGIGVQLDPDADDYDSIIDTNFVGKLIGTIVKVHVQELNWNTLTGDFRASLTTGIPGQTLTRIPGHCEFRRDPVPTH